MGLFDFLKSGKNTSTTSSNNASDNNAYRSPHDIKKEQEEAQKIATRENIEKTLVDLRVKLRISKSDVYAAIKNVRRIDSTPPVDKVARINAMRKLRMRVAQLRFIQTMNDNMELIVSELSMREITQEFTSSMLDMSKLIQTYDRCATSPAKVTAELLKQIKPGQTASSLEEYDKLYSQLCNIYDPKNTAVSGISEQWLEDLVAGTADYSALAEELAEEDASLYTADPEEFVDNYTAPASVDIPSTPSAQPTNRSDDSELSDAEALEIMKAWRNRNN